MQDQLTVRLPADLNRALRHASKRLRRRNSDIVRLALEAYLQTDHTDERRPAERVRHLLGSVSSGIPDLADRHREYVLASLKRGR
jgi:predicted DNA-binding protein